VHEIIALVSVSFHRNWCKLLILRESNLRDQEVGSGRRRQHFSCIKPPDLVQTEASEKWIDK